MVDSYTSNETTSLQNQKYLIQKFTIKRKEKDSYKLKFNLIFRAHRYRDVLPHIHTPF